MRLRPDVANAPHEVGVEPLPTLAELTMGTEMLPKKSVTESVTASVVLPIISNVAESLSVSEGCSAESVLGVG